MSVAGGDFADLYMEKFSTGCRTQAQARFYGIGAGVQGQCQTLVRWQIVGGAGGGTFHYPAGGVPRICQLFAGFFHLQYSLPA